MEIKGVFDTNILIDYLNGIDCAKEEFTKYNTKLISIITWMEILVGISSSEEEKEIRNFLRKFKIITIDEQVSEAAIVLRRSRKIKLPDAIIWATALTQNSLLITRNIKDFSTSEPNIRIPY